MCHLTWIHVSFSIYGIFWQGDSPPAAHQPPHNRSLPFVYFQSVSQCHHWCPQLLCWKGVISLFLFTFFPAHQCTTLCITARSEIPNPNVYSFLLQLLLHNFDHPYSLFWTILNLNPFFWHEGTKTVYCI